jgi:hypothetical protein
MWLFENVLGPKKTVFVGYKLNQAASLVKAPTAVPVYCAGKASLKMIQYGLHLKARRGASTGTRVRS